MLATVLGAGVAAVAPGAAAQDANDLARAREAFKQALADEQAGQFEKAATEFDSARTLAQKETPQVLFHLGVCHARLGRLVQARGELRSAVERATADELDKVAATAKTELDAVLPRIGTITVKKPPQGTVTSMTLDRVDATAKLGSPVDVDPGPHDVHAELSGAPSADVHVTVAEGEHKDVALPGPGGGAPAPLVAPVASPTSTPTSPPAPGANTQTPAPDSAPSSMSKTLGWVLVGTGAAALVGGTVFWVLRSNEVNTLNGECGPTQQTCPKGAQSDIDSGKLDDTLGVTLFIAGGAAVLAGAGLLVFGGHSSPAMAVHVTPFVTGRSAGIGVTGATW